MYSVKPRVATNFSPFSLGLDTVSLRSSLYIIALTVRDSFISFLDLVTKNTLKPYTLYAIHVRRILISTGAIESTWGVRRRYRDFDRLHELIIKNVSF